MFVTYNKDAVPDQIKLKMLELSVRRGQSNFSTVYISSCEEKDCYRDFSIAEVGFGRRSILRAQPVYAMASSKYFFSDLFLFLSREV